MPLSEYEGKVRYECYEEDIEPKIGNASAIAVGPGLGMSEEVTEFVNKVVDFIRGIFG